MEATIALIRRGLTYVIGFSVFFNLLMLIPALYMIQVFDRVLISKSQETLYVLLAGAGIGLVLMMLLDFTRTRLQTLLASLVSESVQPVLAKHLLGSSDALERTNAATALRDATTLQNVLASPALVALIDSPWLFIYCGVIALFHPALGIAAFGAALIMLFLTVLGAWVTRKDIKAFQEESARSNRYFSNAVRNAEAIHALGVTEDVTRTWRGMAADGTRIQARLNPRVATFAALSRTYRQLVQIAILSLGAYLVIANFATPGIMIATTILLGRALAPMEQVVGSWRLLAEGHAAYKSLSKLLPEAETKQAGTHLVLPPPTGQVSVSNVTYKPPGTDRLTLTGISFELQPGDSLAIVGPTSAGKSTLARLLIGISKPTIGSIRYDGVEVATWPREELGPGIGYIPQDIHLFEGTIAQNIARMQKCDPGAVIDAAKRAHVHETILSLPQGYDTRFDPLQPIVSPGQCQRIALARALFGDPKILVFDEPNSNLDNEGEQALLRAVQQMTAEGRTLVVVSHRPSLLQVVKNVLVLEAGRVRHFGPLKSVVAGVPASSEHDAAVAEPSPAQSPPTVLSQGVGGSAVTSYRQVRS